ncbi:MAG: TonB-dependent receptor [Fidelibacterota bacterium]|nr:MAG: TonB-dependent receptor [Candidatus Neomarinimicrobiota bacterium]
MNEYLLPSVQLKYSPFNWMDIRYAYTQTLARPDFHQLSPKYTMSTDFKNVWAGNPDLKPARSLNNDLMLTFYGNKLGLLSLGVFAKTIKDFTYFTRYQLYDSTTAGLRTLDSFQPWEPYPGAWLNTYLNTPYDAYVKGIEFDFQTRFWYLPAGLDGVVLGINYTKIESEATYPLRDTKTLWQPFPLPPITYTIDSTRTGRLIHQPNDILNAYIGYERGGFSARVSFLFQGNAVSYIGAFPEQDGYTQDYFRIDASARQKLPVLGAEIYLDCSNLNSATNASAQRSIDGFTSEKHYGLTANLGIRFKL